MIDPTEDDIGRAVVYRPYHARDAERGSEWEHGRITSIKFGNRPIVYVLYHTRADGRKNTGTTSEATWCEDLWWA